MKPFRSHRQWKITVTAFCVAVTALAIALNRIEFWVPVLAADIYFLWRITVTAGRR